MSDLAVISNVGFYRIDDIIGNPKADPPIPAIIPISKAGFYAGIKKGIYPAPTKHGSMSFWGKSIIHKLVESISNGESQSDISGEQS